MLPAVQGLFTLARELALREPVTWGSSPKWLVQRHGLAPMAGRAGVPELREDLARAVLRWTRTKADLLTVVSRFAEVGVRVALLKGVAYATSVYEAAAERPMTDIDLLVERRHLRAANRVLSDSGFVATSTVKGHHAIAWVRGDLVIDLHHSIIGEGRSRIDIDGIWSRTVNGPWRGTHQLDPVDSFVFHLIHLARNRCYGALVRVVDAARLRERIGPNGLGDAFARARDWGLERAVRLSWRFCSDVLTGADARPGGWLGPDPERLALFYEPPLSRKLLFDVVAAGSPLQLAATTRFHLRALRARFSNQ